MQTLTKGRWMFALVKMWGLTIATNFLSAFVWLSKADQILKLGLTVVGLATGTIALLVTYRTWKIKAIEYAIAKNHLCKGCLASVEPSPDCPYKPECRPEYCLHRHKVSDQVVAI